MSLNDRPLPSVLLIGQGTIHQEIRQLLSPEVKVATPAMIPPDLSVIVDALAAPMEEKRNLIQATLAQAPRAVTLITCSLCFPVTEIASWTERPEKVVGFGYVSPLTEAKLVEIAAGLRSEAETIEDASWFFQAVGKETELVSDSAGLVLPRILCLIINEAITVLSEGLATREDIDRAMKLGTNYPYGPLEWADRIGLDLVEQILEGILREQNEDRYRPAPLLKKMVLAGWLGRKAGKGFYEYGEPKG
jgi:3-hydroxybutyryl-CoA dehydrogenase